LALLLIVIVIQKSNSVRSIQRGAAPRDGRKTNIAEDPLLLLIVSSHAATTDTSRCGLGV